MATPAKTPTINDVLARKRLVEDEIKTLLTKKETLEKDIRDFQASFDDCGRDHEKLVAESEGRVAAASKVLSDKEHDILKVAEMKRKLDTTIEELKKKKAHYESLIAHNHRENKKIEEQKLLLENDAKTRASQLTEELFKKEQALAEIEDMIDAASFSLSTINSEYLEKKTELENKEKELNARYDALESKESRFKVYEKRITGIYEKLYPNIKLRI